MNHVVVGIISRVRNNKKEYLLISSKNDFGKYTGFYYPPGGHLEPNENENDALIREINEELDILVNPINKIAETPGDVKNQLTHWWFCEANTSKLNPDNEELDDVDWFTRAEILENQKVWPATKAFFKKYLSD